MKSFAAPAITFALTLDQIDLDRYLPPPDSKQDAAGNGSGKSRAGSGCQRYRETTCTGRETAAGTLRRLNLNGDVRIARLKAFNLRSRDVQVQIRAKDGLLEISPLAAQLYDGAIKLDMKLDARKDTPRFSVKESLSGVQAGPLLKDLTGDDKLLGTADVKASLDGAGNNADEIINTLNGTAEFSFTDGAVKGVNIAALIRKAQSTLKGESGTKAGSAKSNRLRLDERFGDGEQTALLKMTTW